MKYIVEFMVAQNVTIEGIEASDRDEAVKKARLLFNENKSDYIDEHEIGIDSVTFINEE